MRVNEPVCERETDSDKKNRLVVASGGGWEEERQIGSLGLADANYYI